MAEPGHAGLIKVGPGRCMTEMDSGGLKFLKDSSGVILYHLTWKIYVTFQRNAYCEILSSLGVCPLVR